jgi:hypothetical protein
MEQTETATAFRERQRNLALEAAMNRLLHDLRPFMMAYPRVADAEMPDHDMVWVDNLMPANSPARVILDAIKANPALWMEALPAEVCVVPRKILEKMLPSTVSDTIDYLHGYGIALVLNHAARYAHDLDEQRFRQSISTKLPEHERNKGE